MALTNLEGLVCDPVAGLVEIPCIKRNVGGVMNALSAADLALAGVQSYIPFDDAVKMASKTPADMLGINKGRIEKGYDADLLIVDKDINLKTVIIGGEVFN